MAPALSRQSASRRYGLAALSILALAASAPPVCALNTIHPSPSLSSPPAPTLNPTDSISQTVQKAHQPWIISAKDSLVSTVSRLLGQALPDSGFFSYDLDQFNDMQDAANLPTDLGAISEGAALNWGGSTLEVVRSQAIFLTRPAAFGPRITSDDGLRGFLLPISDFYRLPTTDTRSNSEAMHACPYSGGPGWKSDVLSSYDDPNDQKLYSALLEEPSYSPSARTQNSDANHASPDKPPNDWIALVERGGGCGFAAKVRVAQELGAIAVVVGDAPDPNWHGGKNGDPNEEGDPGQSGKRLITMFAPGDTSDIRIPSTFVTRPGYLDLERLIDELQKDELDWQAQHPSHRRHVGTHGLEIVISRDDMMWQWPLLDLGIILLLLPSLMTVLTVILQRIRMIRQRRRDRAPELVVLGLPCLIWRGNGQPWEKIEGPDTDPGPGNGTSTPSSPSTRPRLISPDLEAGTTDETIPLLQEDENGAGPSQRINAIKVSPPAPVSSTRKAPAFPPPGRTYFSTDECAICLCDFVDGDRVRVLPCGHIFHRQEIDDWLVRVKKLCPICKRDITVPIPPTLPMRLPSSTATNPSPDTMVTAAPTTTTAPTTIADPAVESIDLL